MCRLLAYLGQPALLAEVVLRPDRSIIIQSFDARERKQDPNLPHHVGFGNLNGDGFGIGWFGDSRGADTKPCVFTSVTPAWNNENLNRLAEKIVSPLMFAHVRAAYPGMPVSEQNCHPFMYNNYLWMHNGVIGGFNKVRRKLSGMLSDEAYNAVPSLSNSDSAMAFALFLHHLPSLEDRLPSKTLLDAMETTIAVICSVTGEAGTTENSLLNFVVSDGATLIATRFSSKEGESPASLYYAEGWSFERVVEQSAEESAGFFASQKEYRLKHGTTGSKLVMVASEPITNSCTDWVKVPPNTALVVTKEKGDFVNVLRSPLSTNGRHSLQMEIALCLEAVQEGRQTGGRLWRSFVDMDEQAEAAHADQSAKRSMPGALSPPPVPSRHRSSTDGLAGEASIYRPDHTLTGHTDAVTSMMEHEGRLYSASADCTIQVWELNDIKWAGRLEGHQRPVVDLVASGKYLYSLAGRTFRIWDLEHLECIQIVYLGQAQMVMTGECSYRGGACRAIALSGDGLVYAGYQDSNMAIYDTSNWISQDLSAQGNTHESCVFPFSDCASQSAKEGLARTASMRGPAFNAEAVINTADDAYEHIARGQIKAHLGAVNDIVLIGNFVCSCAGDAMIRLTDVKNLEPKGTLRGHRGSVLCLAAAGDLLLSGGRDNTIRVWDMDSMCCRRTLQGHKHDVLNIQTLEVLPPSLEASRGQQSKWSAFQAAKKPFVFASTCADATARLWCGKEWICLRVFMPNASPSVPPAAGYNGPGQHSRASALSSVLGNFAGHNPMACITCAPGVQISRATKLLSHLARNGSLKSRLVERSRDALQGLVLTPDRLICGNLGGTVYVFSIHQVYKDLVSTSFEDQSPQDDGLSVVTRAASDADINELLEGVTSPRAKRRKLITSDAELLDILRDFIAIPSISADPYLSDECFRAAKFLAKQLEALGAEVKMTQVTEGKNPVVIGRLGRNPAVPTVTFYGHYDVQPACEDNWMTNPFEVASVDGYLYGRGTSDNKGPILGFVFAVRELLDACTESGKELPVNCAFCFEGEEENGSHGFAPTLEANKHWFEGTQAIMVSNTLWIGESQPCLTYGMRGLICMDIAVSGPQRDLHSGNDGGVFNEPLVDLVNVIGTLVDGRNSILVPGFDDGIEGHHQDRKNLDIIENSREFNLSSYRERLGVPALTNQRSTSDLLYTRWCNPSMSVVDIRAGDTAVDKTAGTGGCYRFGPTRFSVIPHLAVGKLSIRFVPKQRPDHLISCVKNHLQHEFAKLRTLNSLSVSVVNCGDYWEADTTSRVFRIAEHAVEKEWSMPPLHVREGGTMPMVATLEKILRAPAIMLPFGQSSDNPHLANERIRGVNLIRGKNVVRHFLEDFAGKLSQ